MDTLEIVDKVLTQGYTTAIEVLAQALKAKVPGKYDGYLNLIISTSHSLSDKIAEELMAGLH